MFINILRPISHGVLKGFSSFALVSLLPWTLSCFPAWKELYSTRNSILVQILWNLPCITKSHALEYLSVSNKTLTLFYQGQTVWVFLWHGLGPRWECRTPSYSFVVCSLHHPHLWDYETRMCGAYGECLKLFFLFEVSLRFQ